MEIRLPDGTVGDTEDREFWGLGGVHDKFKGLSEEEQMQAMGLRYSHSVPPGNYRVYVFDYWPEVSVQLRTWGTRSDPRDFLFFLCRFVDFIEEVGGVISITPATFGGYEMACSSGWRIRGKTHEGTLSGSWHPPKGFVIRTDSWDWPLFHNVAPGQVLLEIAAWRDKMHQLARESLALLD